jgi:hypothetical protein
MKSQETSEGKLRYLSLNIDAYKLEKIAAAANSSSNGF